MSWSASQQLLCSQHIQLKIFGQELEVSILLKKLQLRLKGRHSILDQKEDEEKIEELKALVPSFLGK